MNQDPKASVESGTTAAPVKTKWKPLRIWPALILLAGIVGLRFVPPLMEDGPFLILIAAFMGPPLCGILIPIWWVAFSRATILERIVGFLGIILAATLTFTLMDKSMQGPAASFLIIPLGTLSFALGAIVCHRMLSFRRTWIALLMAFLGFGVWTLMRSDGIWGNFAIGLHFRWTPSAEDKMLQSGTRRPVEKTLPDGAAEALVHPEWPDFRGPNRDGEEHGTMLSEDWKTNPPKQIWKIAVGPGWSSFAVAGPLLFTQEQRGESETVVCYAADTGGEIWTRFVKARFEESMGGPGPRATPTLANGALYVMGAMGDLLKLDPKTGEEIWQQDLRKIADRKTPPMWGFSSSPLVVDSIVIVHAGGKDDKGVLAFNTEDGKLQWSVPSGDHSYSSPQLSTIDGERVVLMLTNAGLNIIDPATGKSLLNYDWPFENYRVLQPQVVDGDSILLATPMGGGVRRIKVTRVEGQFKAEEVWTSMTFKTDYNDLIVYNGHAYGFDGAIFSCYDPKTGQRNWKGGRYGKGQVLLQQDSGLLIVMGEYGEVFLVKADPKGLNELGKFQAINGKTWNHPVLIGDRLYVRNAEEAACYQLPLIQ